MKFIIIGLGNYGKQLAEDLTNLGHEIIGVDNNSNNIDKIKDKIAVSYILDATDEQAVSALPVRTVDAVIVAIGEDFGVSIKIVSLLKKFKAGQIYARAIDNVHKAILEAFNVDKILCPEEDSARDFALNIGYKINVDSMEIGKDIFLLKIKVPDFISGKSLSALQNINKYNLKIVALFHSVVEKNFIGLLHNALTAVEDKDFLNEVLIEGDVVVCIGKQSDLVKLLKDIEPN
jgi:trk system potassium uptake protein